MSQAEAVEVLGESAATVIRRVSRSLQRLADAPSDLYADDPGG
jgi:hypothetical protein